MRKRRKKLAECLTVENSKRCRRFYNNSCQEESSAGFKDILYTAKNVEEGVELFKVSKCRKIFFSFIL